MVELYRAWSNVTEIGNGQSKILWIPLRAERIRLAPYNDLISGLDDMNSYQASIAKGYVDEFFTLSELNMFRKYIENVPGISICQKGYSAPLTCMDGDMQNIVPFRCRGLHDIVKNPGSLSMDTDFALLPFDISGYLVRESEIQ